MGLETTTTIEGLNEAWPLTSDSRTVTDDNLRMLKNVLKETFPGAGGNGFNTAISATETELNYVDGVTGPIQEQLDAKAPLASPTLTGTPTAPTPTTGNNSQQIPNTSWVNAAIAANAPALRMAAKAWLKAGPTGNILTSYGIASIVDTGTGILTVNFSTPFSGFNYVCCATVDKASTANIRVEVQSASQVILKCTYLADGLHQTFDLVDPAAWHLAVFGDQ